MLDLRNGQNLTDNRSEPRDVSPPERAEWDRKDTIFLAVLIGLTLVLWLPRFRGPIDLRYDAGVYYICGTALTEGKGYRILSEPGEIHAVQYPPLLSVIVAAHQWALRTTDPTRVGPALRITFFLLFTLYIAGIYVWVRHYLTAGYAFLAALVCLLSVLALFMADLLFAEIPFALMTILFLLAKSRSRQRRYAVLAAVLAVGAYLLRTAGTALLAAWVAEGLLQREFKRAAIRAALALIPILGWQGYILQVKHSQEYAQPAYAYQRADYLFYNVGYVENIAYVDPFRPELGKISSLRNVASRLFYNGIGMPWSLAESVTAERPGWEAQRQRVKERFPFLPWPAWAAPLILLTFSGLIIGGAVLLAVRQEWFIPIYGLAYLTLICLTPYIWRGQTSRYLVAIAPLIALCLFRSLVGIRTCVRRFAGPTWKTASAGFTILIVLISLTQESLDTWLMYREFHWEAVYYDQAGQPHSYRLFYYDDAWRELDAAIEWLKTNAQPTDIIVTTAPHWLYLKTGLRAVMPPYEKEVSKAQALLDGVPARYVIVDNLGFLDVTRKYAGAAIQAHPELWRIVYSSPEDGLRIYQRVRP